MNARRPAPTALLLCLVTGCVVPEAGNETGAAAVTPPSPFCDPFKADIIAGVFRAAIDDPQGNITGAIEEGLWNRREDLLDDPFVQQGAIQVVAPTDPAGHWVVKLQAREDSATFDVDPVSFQVTAQVPTAAGLKSCADLAAEKALCDPVRASARQAFQALCTSLKADADRLRQDCGRLSHAGSTIQTLSDSATACGRASGTMDAALSCQRASFSLFPSGP
jgi:hypothetical protein